MEAYQNGDIQAFEELYGRYQNRLEIFFRFRLSKAHLNFVDDLFQVTWMKIHRSRKNFDKTKKFSTWFYQIAINSLRDHLALSRFKEEIISEEIESHSDASFDPSWKIDFEKVKLHMEMLSAVQREVILLSDLEGFDSVEISQMLEVRQDVVRKMLSRARKKLKESLERNSK